jgi:peptidoglycan/xylan/chitin deacetylase (PgdA/CDA1 family)
MLTFDDGYREWATDVLPVLESHGAKAAFFLATGFLDRPRAPWWYEIPWMVSRSPRDGLPTGPFSGALHFDDPRRDAAAYRLLDVYKSLLADQTERFLDWLADATGSGRCPAEETRADWLDWDQARALADAGMEIGGHTADHPVLARLTPADQRSQIAECRLRIEAEIGRPMRLFSYPIGLADSYDAHTRAALAAEDVELAFAYDGGFARSGDPLDRLSVPRVTGGMAPDIFAAALALPQLFARW